LTGSCWWRRGKDRSHRHYGTLQDQDRQEGHYFYNGLPLGNYNVTIEVDGKDVDHTNGVRSKLSDPTNVSFDLQASRRPRRRLSRPPQSGQLTKEMERGLTAEQKAALEKTLKEREGQLKQHKELNDAFNAGMTPWGISSTTRRFNP